MRRKTDPLDPLLPSAAPDRPTEVVPLDALHADPANARRHPERNLQAIRDSLREFGQVEPLIVQEKTGRVIGGNGRLSVMRDLGWKSATVVRLPLSATQATALAIALNRTGELAEWDTQALEMQLKGLAADDFDLENLHFDDISFHNPSEADRDSLSPKSGGADEVLGREALNPETWNRIEEVEEIALPAQATSQPGDVWEMGVHLLRCGDCRNKDDVAALMSGASADMVATDPPYGINYLGIKGDRQAIENDNLEGLQDLLSTSLGNALEITKPGGVWYIAAPGNTPFYFFADFAFKSGVWRQTLVWVKSSLSMSRADFHYRHEAIIYGWKPGAAHQAPPDRRQDSVWEFPKPPRSPDHPTTKPIAMYARMCLTSTNPGDTVYEPFSGSGTTLLACEETGRKCKAMEIHPPYVDVAVKRWELATGKKAIRHPAK